MIRGRKNFLPPHPLIMGLTFLFKLVSPLLFYLCTLRFLHASPHIPEKILCRSDLACMCAGASGNLIPPLWNLSTTSIDPLPEHPSHLNNIVSSATLDKSVMRELGHVLTWGSFDVLPG